MAIFVNMGNYQAKNEQVVIAQSGSENSARAALERKVEVYGILICVITAIVFSVCLFLCIKKCSKRVKSQVVKGILNKVEEGRVGVTKGQVNSQNTVTGCSVVY